ncbi:MAG: CHAT domain-containing protein [Acidobacteria bacterium]|nr:CHAT domain-containing protein [Acidobacteriota bacterium]
MTRLSESKLEPAQRDARRRELQAELSQLEAKLAERVALVAQTVRERNLSLADIARSLPPQSALVDFVHYRRYDFTAKTNMWKEARYAAYLTFPPATGTTNIAVERVDLGEAAPINAAVAELHQLLAEKRIAPQRLEPVLQRLGALLYAPLARHLTNVTHLIVCPDGQLGRLPFELLPVDAKGRRLIEDKLITYVSSGREVARLAQPRAAVATTAPLVMGNPDFDFLLPGSSRREEAPIKPGTPNSESGTNSLSLLTSAATPRQRFLSRSFRDFKFTPLPDSENEARKAAAMLGTNCVLRLGAAAREADLKAVSSPRVLHLATHGFFLTDQEFKRTNGLAENFLLAGSFPAGGSFPARQSFAPPGQDWENPLIRCGIALAGANRATGITNALAEDGILTGLEAALLNLQGTELVILSACDSGSGDVKIGEGVMSLRRAFTIAGAETVLASHWKVNDAATSALMTEFMRRWRAGTPRGQAWREAQLSLLRSKDFSSPYFWAAFTLTGQWR